MNAKPYATSTLPLWEGRESYRVRILGSTTHERAETLSLPMITKALTRGLKGKGRTSP
jgi:hypothetical protein